MGVFKMILVACLIIIYATYLIIQNPTASEWVSENGEILSLAATAMFLVGFLVRWRATKE